MRPGRLPELQARVILLFPKYEGDIDLHIVFRKVWKVVDRGTRREDQSVGPTAFRKLLHRVVQDCEGHW